MHNTVSVFGFLCVTVTFIPVHGVRDRETYMVVYAAVRFNVTQEDDTSRCKAMDENTCSFCSFLVTLKGFT